MFHTHPDDPAPGAVPEASVRVARRAREEMDRLAGLIEEAIDAGLARPVDPKRAATFLWAAWNGLIAMHMRKDAMAIDDVELKALLEQGREIMTFGLLADDQRLRP